MMQPNSFQGSQGFPVPQFTRASFAIIPVLPFLNGQPWDELALAFVSMLNPYYIRVTSGELTTDAISPRVTVFMNEDNLTIRKIELENKVWLPETIENGSALMRAANARGLAV